MKLFVLTNDLFSHISKKPARIKNTDALKSACSLFGEAIRTALNKHTATALYHSEDLMQSIMEHVPPQHLVATLDSSYCASPDMFIHLSAVTINNERRLESRLKGRDWMNASVSSMKRSLPVCLIDSGCKSGWTIRQTIEKLRSRGLNVDSVVVGICHQSAFEKLQRVIPISAVYQCNMLDWIELRDFWLVGTNLSKRYILSLLRQFRIPIAAYEDLSRIIIKYNTLIHPLIATP